MRKAPRSNGKRSSNSLGGEFGIAVTLDESNNVPIPMAGGFVQIPAPGILLVVKVNDDTIFNRIDEELKKNKQVVSADKAGVKMRTMPVPVPLAITLRPTAASSGGYLFIASSDALVQEALDVKAGEKPGLKSTDEFKRLAQGIPDKGNQFSFVSAKFGRAIMEIQKQAIAGQNAQNSSPAQAAWFKSLFRSDNAMFSYSVGHEHARRLPDHRQRQSERRRPCACCRPSPCRECSPPSPSRISSRPAPPRS